MEFDGRNFNNLSNRDKSTILRSNFRAWKFNSLENSSYFIIFQGFEEGEKLKSISGNGLKLYIYLGLHANNYEGVVWHSNKTIAQYFGKSERTVRVWMKELEDLQLIKRMRLEYDGMVYTYLQPYISKYNDNNINEGILYFNDYDELCFQNKFKSSVLFKDEYEIVLFVGKNLSSNMCLEGRLLKMKSKNNDDNDYYIFKDNKNKFKLELNAKEHYGLILKVIMDDKKEL